MLLERIPIVGGSLRLVRQLATHGLLLLDRVRVAALPDRAAGLREQAQRFGAQAFRRVAARWPELAELVFGIKSEPIVAVQAAAAASAERNTPLDRRTPLDAVAARALLAALAGASEWQERASVATQLAFCEGDDVIAALRAALRDESSEVAVAACETLAKKPGAAPTHALLEVLNNADGYFNPVTRVTALRGLAARLRDDELAPLLAALRDVDAEVCIAAIVVLSERGAASTASQLDTLLRDRSGFYLPVVRLAAANALLRLGALDQAQATALHEHETDPAIARVLQHIAQALTS